MITSYFSERESGFIKPRTEETINSVVWVGIYRYIYKWIKSEYFADEFTKMCPDGNGPCGTDTEELELGIKSEFPDLEFPLSPSMLPSTFQILDLLEYLHRVIAKPEPLGYHSYFNHYHYSFEKTVGQAELRNTINRIFSRNGIAFDLNDDGLIIRLTNQELQTKISLASFDTSDSILNSLLETARRKYFSPHLETRLEAVEKLWDAWERLKTIEDPSDKKASIGKLFDKATTNSMFKDALNSEALALTNIGNNFMIRHTEIGKVPIESSQQVDYLFQRMFSLIYFLLGGTTHTSSTETAPENNSEDIPF